VILCIFVISTCLCIYAMRMCLLCLLAGGCQILAGSRMQPMIWWLPGWYKDAARKKPGYCRGGLRIGNGY
jgi:hypothetical protein